MEQTDTQTLDRYFSLNRW